MGTTILKKKRTFHLPPEVKAVFTAQKALVINQTEKFMSDNERKVREKAGDKADEIIEEVRECPDYFVMEGGSDGTFAHMEFLDDFGHLMPEISNLAEEFGGKV